MSFWMNTLIKTNNNSKLRGVLQLSTSTLKSNFHLHRRIITTGTGSTHHNLKLLQLHHQTQAQTRYKATATVTTTNMSPKITTGPIFTVTYVSFTVVRISICSVFTYFVTTSIELLYILPHIRRTHHYFFYLSINVFMYLPHHQSPKTETVENRNTIPVRSMQYTYHTNSNKKSSNG